MRPREAAMLLLLKMFRPCTKAALLKLADDGNVKMDVRTSSTQQQ